MTQEKTIDRDFRGWIVTVEQVNRIKAKDYEAALQFYTDNYDRLQNMAKRYVAIKNAKDISNIYNVTEMLNQLILDLPYLQWDNALTLTCSIRLLSFMWSPYGGYAQRKENHLPVRKLQSEGQKYGLCVDLNHDACSLDEKIHGVGDERAVTLGDTIVADETYNADYYITRNNLLDYNSSDIVALLRDLLTSKQARCLELMLKGYPNERISKELGYKDCSSTVCRVKDILILNYQEIIKRLRALGFDNVEKYINVVPVGYQEILEKTARAREKALERAKKHFANEDNRKRKKEYDRLRYMDRKAREAAQATAAQTAVTSGLA